MKWVCLENAPWLDEEALTCFISERARSALYSACWAELYPELRNLSSGREHSADPTPAVEKRWLAARALLYGAGYEKYLSPREAIKTACANALKTARSLKLRKVRLILDGEYGDAPALIRDLARAAGIAAWSFGKYRAKKDDAWETLELQFVLRAGQTAQAEVIIREAFDLAASVNLARELINEPGNMLPPPELALRSAAAAEDRGLSCEILDQAALAAGGYAGILAVGQGSVHEPRMVVIRYRPDGLHKDARHIALVGKGVTFDTGGVSLKTAKDMHIMKDDMSGAAVALACVHALANLKPNCAVTAILVCAENHFAGSAQRPGDIFRHKSGKYIQVDNTDAEGRLCLIDGLYRAGEEGADTIIDLATLTGACQRALGNSLAGVFGNDALIEELRRAGHEAGEELWPFPLVEEYAKQLETPHADFCNVGGAYAGHIVAALFLRNFVPERARWAHIDLCPAYFEHGWKYYAPGGTAFGVQLLVDWIAAQAVAQAAAQAEQA
ncbi:MAG: leucyl aminopeptidase [Spirochaetota bacterium]|jgi:leucyl aminopeptidase|nr:leucyl aminopeptidase [Spirochaetota bacterium]